ncbi:hypothetical protein CSUI_002772 [Cystoisospora suis]|uniref:Uncharacterized protein n=1 Tax=Cystoisospora suis TaxID=483139 RepID=A0A2C6KH50_9APIC|nr:hypothetical protein CSUI_002772 [Cystoisospora suis]
MGCANSKPKAKNKRQSVAHLAAAFDQGKVGGTTAAKQSAEAHRKDRDQQLAKLRASKTHKEQNAAARKEVAACFQNTPPTGGLPPPELRYSRPE